jgi:hypothetical protein
MGFSLSFLKKTDSAAGAANAGNPAEGGSLRGRAMVIVAVIGLSIGGYKMFWPQSAPIAAKAKTPTAQKTPTGSAKPRTPSAGSGSARANTPVKTKSAPSRAVSAGDDTDVPAPSEMAARGPHGRPMPATKPVPAPMTDSLLGPIFVDETNGFSMRFPAGWALRHFAGEPWVLDCGDGKLGLVSIGFSPFPADFTADNIPPEWVARRIKKRNDTTLHSQGYALIAGKKALWSKSTGPLPMTNGSPKMTRVNYIMPLGDGRVMELRIAATPELFDQLMPTMRAAVESFRLIPRTSPAK